tara:strand:+ start:3208 stop:5181 length:1974 start_codon:yes stop_codon:yes gene_type:complete
MKLNKLKKRIRVEFGSLRLYFLDLPRISKLILSISVDSFLCFLAVYGAFYLRIGQFEELNYPILLAFSISILFAIPTFFFSGLYRTIFRYSGWPAMLVVSKSIFIYGLLYSFLLTLLGFEGIPRTVGAIQPLLLFFMVGSSRSIVAFWLGDIYKNRLKSSNLPRALIYGAGRVGRDLVLTLKNSNNLNVIGFIDDDPKKYLRLLCEKQIFNLKDLPELVSKKKVSLLLLAMPSASREKRNLIIQEALKYKLAVRTCPDLINIADGKIDSTNLVDLGIEDLLGREKVEPDQNLMKKNIESKVVLVTGAGGSIGSQLCREVLQIKPKKLLLLDSNEFSLYSILNELDIANDSYDVEIIPLLASIQDKKTIRLILNSWKPSTVYHAAAYKHVPIVEHNLSEGVKNNVLGTLSIAQASLDFGVSDFVFISTDKAVRPTNVMGATKRLGEICLQALFQNKDNDKQTKLSMVRFGNVLDSSGSVIPKFRKQIQNRTPITLTHPDITRFFMTIKEAAELVIQAGAMAYGGDVFVLDMGEPVKIYDLAKKMIQLSGLKLKNKDNLNGDIEILITGLRPGEKLFEELLIGNNPLPTIHPKIFRAQDEFIKWNELEESLKVLEEMIEDNNTERILSILEKLVHGYKPSKKIVDWIYNEKLKKKNQSF